MNHTRQPAFIAYRQNRFSTRLPTNRLYSAAHFWIAEVQPGRQRVGLTKFATRMLGDLVEMGAEAAPGDDVAVGQIIGWVEALKAASDLYAMAAGTFVGTNPALADDPELLQKDPYERGWLYEIDGTPEPDAVDAQGYAEHLDAVIKKMLGEQS